jgi:ABC-type sugar transport system ATPase subunit
VLHYVKVHFHNFKAFEDFTLNIQNFNILVGPNNAGKSTIISAFRILAAGLRRANARRASLVHGPNGTTSAHPVDLSSLSVAGENVFFNYDDSEAATVRFDLSDKRSLTLYFPERETCYLIPDALGQSCDAPAEFRRLFNCPIGFVPVLGPVEADEQLYDKEAARLALFNYRAARNFRNIWWHFSEPFSQFQEAIRSTWPGMDVKPPELQVIENKPLLRMFCPEQRIDREIVWSGFGFQVWCQMLTHLIQAREASIFLIDEPDIYLHSDLQRQLVGLLRSLGPDILIATHSTEIITEAERGEIILINKKRRTAKRIVDQADIEAVFRELGSNANPILTQLAKTKRAVFVEGQDFQILSQFARKLEFNTVANRASFAVLPMEGFNPERAKTLREGVELTLGSKVRSVAVLDRDFRSSTECKYLAKNGEAFNDWVRIHARKEIENFLLVPTALDRAIQRRLEDREKRTGVKPPSPRSAMEMLSDFRTKQHSYVLSRRIELSKKHEKKVGSKLHPDVLTEQAIDEFEKEWRADDVHFALVPGKSALAAINQELQTASSVTLTPSNIIAAMRVDEIPADMKALLIKIDEFART